MARANGNNKQLNKQLEQRAAQQGNNAVTYSIKALLNSDSITKRFDAILKNRSPQYMSSVVNLVNSDANLMKVDPMSVVASCIIAATLDLPIEKNLGYAWIVPYGGRATFQMGYKGYIQLALRMGKYKAMNAIPIHEGELEIDFESKESDVVIGYAGYFELINGFRKTVYWTKQEIEAHRKRFSKSGFGWNNDWDAMALKTVIRNMLSKWGILSVEMQQAYVEDEKDAPMTPDMGEPPIDIPLNESEPVEGQERATEQQADESKSEIPDADQSGLNIGNGESISEEDLGF